MALGAGRGRLTRQVLFEHLILASTAGVIAWWLADVAAAIWSAASETVYSSHDFSAGPGTLLYLAAVTLGAALLISLAPVFHMWRVDIGTALKSEGRGATMTARTKRFAAALVAGQMALAVIPIASAGVLGRSVWNIVSADVGVDSPELVLVGNVTLPFERYSTPESILRFYGNLEAGLGSLPGVEAVAIGNARPLDELEPRAAELAGQAGEQINSPILASSPDYFSVIGAEVLEGRDFLASDGPGSPPVVLVNQSFAQTYFPGTNPIGERLRAYDKASLLPGEWRTVVGVVSNVMHNESTRQQFRPVTYVPLAQQAERSVWYFVRTQTVWNGLAAAIRDRLSEMDSLLEVATPSTLRSSMAFEFASERMMGSVRDLAKNAYIAPIYAALALLLAAIGLYAVVARAVIQRRTEIGIRMALGATTRGLRGLIVVEGMLPVAIGLAVGLPASLAVNRMLQSKLVGVSAYDTLTLVVATFVLLAVALAGCLQPARMASGMDPVQALRRE